MGTMMADCGIIKEIVIFQAGKQISPGIQNTDAGGCTCKAAGSHALGYEDDPVLVYPDIGRPFKTGPDIKDGSVFVKKLHPVVGSIGYYEEKQEGFISHACGSYDSVRTYRLRQL